MDTSKWSDQIAGLIGDARSAGKDISDFIQQQAPDLFREIVYWKTIQSIESTLMTFIIFLILFFVAKYLFKRSKTVPDTLHDTEGDDRFTYKLFSIISGILAVVLLFFTIDNSTEIFKCVYAPKLVVLEYCKDLLTTAARHSTNN